MSSGSFAILDHLFSGCPRSVQSSSGRATGTNRGTELAGKQGLGPRRPDLVQSSAHHVLSFIQTHIESSLSIGDLS